MNNRNKFKLGVFGLNSSNGIAMTKADERWAAEWDDIAAAAKMADRAGFEFILPLARWKGYGGETDPRGTCMETLSFAAALSGITSYSTVFSTAHVPLVHPVFAARSLATIDQASHGRAGLNIVCGWNEEEFAMFGIENVADEDRYDQGFEWQEIVSRLLCGEGPFDYDGKYYQLKGIYSQPAGFQGRRPPMFSAAFSPAGREFALRTCDYLFTTFASIDRVGGHIAKLKEAADNYDRQINFCSTTHVVCRESQQEAEDYYQFYADEMADNVAVENFITANSDHKHKAVIVAMRRKKKRIAGGFGSYPLVGTPSHIARELVLMSEAGFSGTTVSFVDFRQELPFFIEHVLPLLEQAKIRVKF